MYTVTQRTYSEYLSDLKIGKAKSDGKNLNNLIISCTFLQKDLKFFD